MGKATKIEKLAGLIREAWLDDGEFSPKERRTIRREKPNSIPWEKLKPALDKIVKGHGVVSSLPPHRGLAELIHMLNPGGQYNLADARLAALKDKQAELAACPTQPTARAHLYAPKAIVSHVADVKIVGDPKCMGADVRLDELSKEIDRIGEGIRTYLER